MFDFVYISADSVWAQDTEWVEMKVVEYIYNTQKERVTSNVEGLEIDDYILTALSSNRDMILYLYMVECFTMKLYYITL